MNNTMQYKGYTAAIEYSAADETFFGKVQGINDSVTFDAASVTELKHCFEVAIEDYLKTCDELGKK